MARARDPLPRGGDKGSGAALRRSKTRIGNARVQSVVDRVREVIDLTTFWMYKSRVHPTMPKPTVSSPLLGRIVDQVWKHEKWEREFLVGNGSLMDGMKYERVVSAMRRRAFEFWGRKHVNEAMEIRTRLAKWFARVERGAEAVGPEDVEVAQRLDHELLNAIEKAHK
jgi:hypothetical protein